MAVSLVLLAAVLAVANGRPELSDGPQNEEFFVETIKTRTLCSMTIELEYPAEEKKPPNPLCSIWCQSGGELWIDGVVVKRLSDLEAYGLMVEMTYKNGSLQDCKMVPYVTYENYAVRQEAQKRCTESYNSSDTESQDEVLVLSVTELIPDSLHSIPMHQRLEGFTHVGNSNYLVSPEAMSWQNAVKYCDQLGAPLAFIESSVEQNHLEGSLSTEVWISLNDIVAEGIFVNAGNTPITYTNWYPGEPNGLLDEDCVGVRPNRQFRWNDAPCNVNQHALCEHPLVDKSQAKYECPRGYWQYESSCYILSSTAETYLRGEEFCSSQSAYPVFINSLDEHSFLKGMLSESAYIGFFYSTDAGTFLSRRFGIPLFKWWGEKPRQQPDARDRGENCVAIPSWYGFFWHDYQCETKFKMLCEKAAQIRD